uniref:Pre-mRNA-splicing factor RBM22 n=1 Tax=Pyrodinium bahamense TaxID=73915 RepID=A0A7S0ANN7_9DINO|mmetsp:Transcript_3721/g.10260  ORF Transcript_3721/g.10260 Transcript_3721/m.10260 type:complete len:376 (+) Transcript_3721:132-1259(+)
MTERGYRIAAEVNKEGWEKSTFPILCETCLGDNPYVRMQKEDYGVECKICVRPFTIFRWKAGTKGRYKATVVCQSCARIKNVCQTCLFDLEFGLPVQVRDKFLEEQGQTKIALPASRVGRDYQLQEAQKAADANDLPYGKVAAHPMLQRLARMTPYYKRNEARICTFYVKGACNRGQDCPFRHELPEGGELANQKLRDRFHGENDPVAAKILRRADEEMTLLPPEDKSITTLYLGGLEYSVREKDVRDKFFVFGEIRSIRMVPRQCCAFVTFVKREAAEEAASQLHRVLELKGRRVNLLWGRPQAARPGLPSAGAASGSSAAGLLPPAAAAGVLGGPALPADVYRPYYPSTDPAAQGNAPLQGEAPDEQGLGGPT